MNNKKKKRSEVREAKQEKQAKKVVNWIFGVLIALAILFWIYAVTFIS